MRSGSNIVTEVTEQLYELFKSKKSPEIINLLKSSKNFDVNAPLISSGFLKGYTALHLSCLESNSELVKLLVEDQNADVNAVAEDGTQPIHLCSVPGSSHINEILLKNGADINTQVTKSILSNRKKYTKWFDEFGDTVPLLTFSLFNDATDVAHLLLYYGANVSTKSLNGKTLLMFAFERYQFGLAENIIFKMDDYCPELINARDSDGLHAVHYLLDYESYGNYRYDKADFVYSEEKRRMVEVLVIVNADLRATVNGDPDTMLINMAAYRCCRSILEELLPQWRCLEGCQLLQNVTLPIAEGEKNFKPISHNRTKFSDKKMKKNRRTCLSLILGDLVNRRAFGLYIPKEEKELLDLLINERPDFKEFVEHHKEAYIEGVLKDKRIYYNSSKSVTVYEFLKNTFDDKLLKMMIYDKELIGAAENFDSTNEFANLFICMALGRIKDKKIRNELLEQLKKISHLRSSIPLPFEIILEIIEFLNNTELKDFIDGFYTGNVVLVNE